MCPQQEDAWKLVQVGRKLEGGSELLKQAEKYRKLHPSIIESMPFACANISKLQVSLSADEDLGPANLLNHYSPTPTKCPSKAHLGTPSSR